MKIGKIKFSICTFQFAISNIITRYGSTGAPRQWTPRANGRHACASDANLSHTCLLMKSNIPALKERVK